jgi:N-succinyldiaminopimelate aminotransferase
MTDPLRTAMQPFGTSVFSTLTELAVKHRAVNLAQGFPDFEPPQQLLDAAAEALRSGYSQYAPSPGYPDLRQAVAAHQFAHYGQRWDPDTEVTVTVGATEAIWSTVAALTEPGDEVLLFEPYYDMYPAAVAAAGCVATVVPGTGFPDFAIDLDALTDAIGPRTRLAILNTPTNPTGRLVGGEELRVLGELCQRYGVTVVADEAYEHVVLDGLAHRPVAAEPALADRTVTVSSASKTFSATGWRVGWAVAPAPLTGALRRVHQFVTFAAASPLQRAVGALLAGAGPDFYAELTASYQERRDVLRDYLDRIGLELGPSEGAYFLIARCPGDEVDYCERLVERAGVVAIPASAFYAERARGRGLVRFAFCKRVETLRDAGERLVTGAAPVRG